MEESNNTDGRAVEIGSKDHERNDDADVDVDATAARMGNENDKIRDSTGLLGHRDCDAAAGSKTVDASFREQIGSVTTHASEWINAHIILVRYGTFATIGLLTAYGIAHSPLLFRYRTVAELPTSYFLQRRTIVGRLVARVPITVSTTRSANFRQQQQQQHHEQPRPIDWNDTTTKEQARTATRTTTATAATGTESMGTDPPVLFLMRHLSLAERWLPQSWSQWLVARSTTSTITAQQKQQGLMFYDRNNLLLVQIAGIHASVQQDLGRHMNDLDRLIQQQGIIRCQLLARRLVTMQQQQPSTPLSGTIPIPATTRSRFDTTGQNNDNSNSNYSNTNISSSRYSMSPWTTKWKSDHEQHDQFHLPRDSVAVALCKVQHRPLTVASTTTTARVGNESYLSWFYGSWSMILGRHRQMVDLAESLLVQGQASVSLDYGLFPPTCTPSMTPPNELFAHLLGTTTVQENGTVHTNDDYGQDDNGVRSIHERIVDTSHDVARHIQHDTRYQDVLQRAEMHAIQGAYGMWSDPTIVWHKRSNVAAELEFQHQLEQERSFIKRWIRWGWKKWRDR